MANIVTAIVNKDNWVKAYLTLWQGMLGLTEKELNVAISLVKHFLIVKEKINDSDTASIVMLSRNNRRKIKHEHQLSSAGFGNYLISLRKKGLLVEKDGNLTLADKVIPQKTITFNFNVNDSI